MAKSLSLNSPERRSRSLEYAVHFAPCGLAPANLEIGSKRKRGQAYLGRSASGQAYLGRSASGQALVEFLPAVMIFILVLSGGLAYFRVMRRATIYQEAARNLAFAKIDFAGTLTTVSVDDGNSSKPKDISIGVETGSMPAISGGSNSFIDASTNCFYVHPEGSGIKSVPVTLRGGVVVDRPVQFMTYAAVCRR